jgi:2-keto-4-pentenoate hydratase
LQRLRNNQPYRNLSAYCAGATIADAYELQRAFVQALVEAGDWGSVVGYKAALTAPQAQQMMGASEPVVGVLFSGGERLAQRTISIDRPVMLETELGFRLNRPIDAATTESTTPTYIEHVSPMIELAAPNLEQRPNAVDLIASNSATYGFITGSAYNTDWQDATTRPDLDRLSINLFHGDDILHAETAGSIMQGQWHAVTWLVNALLELGYPLAKEHLLMTGSIGALHPGKPGEYRAEYGQLGNIEFNL